MDQTRNGLEIVLDTMMQLTNEFIIVGQGADRSHRRRPARVIEARRIEAHRFDDGTPDDRACGARVPPASRGANVPATHWPSAETGHLLTIPPGSVRRVTFRVDHRIPFGAL